MYPAYLVNRLIEVEPLLDQVVAIRAGEVIKVMDLDAFRSNEGMSLAEWMTNVYAGHTHKMRRV